jgi:hypothetical protein
MMGGRSVFRAAGILVVLALTAGCGGNSYKARAKVKGQVRYFDKTLTAGTVSFIGTEGRVGSANIDFTGHYEMSDAPIGEVTITVTTPSMGPGGRGKIGPPKPPPGVPEMQPPGDVAGAPPPAIDPSKIVPIPGKYAKAETSGLKFTVAPGEQTHDIVLTP